MLTSQIIPFVKYIVTNRKKIKHSINFEGEHGIGKTQLVTLACYEMNVPLRVLHLGQVETPQDLMGMPITDLLFRDKNGNEVWANQYNQYTSLEPVIVNNEQVSRTRYGINYWWPEEGGVLFLDDFTRNQALMQCAMEMFESKTFMGIKFPENITVIGSSNPEGGDYQVATLDGAQKTRMMTYKVKFDSNYWLDFAEKNLMDSVVSFVRVNPEIWSNTCCRQIEKFNDMISCLEENDKYYYDLVSLYGGGAFESSNTFVNLYVSYMKEQFKNLPTIEELYTEGETSSLHMKLKALVDDKTNANASLWVVAIRVVKGLTLNGVNPKNAKRFMELIESKHFTTDKKVLIYNMVMKNKHTNILINDLMKYEPSYSKWVKDTIAGTLLN